MDNPLISYQSVIPKSRPFVRHRISCYTPSHSAKFKKDYTSVMIVPTGIGAAMGGYAGDALSVARAFSCQLRHFSPQSMLYWPMSNVLYVEGYALDRFAEGLWALQPVHQNSPFGVYVLRWKQVGLVLVAGIKEDLRLRHLQAVDAARASLGLPIIECVVTDTRLEINMTMSSSKGVQLSYKDPNYVVMDNGIVQVILSEPDGNVTGIKYNGIDNLLEFDNEESNRGYWDLVWSQTGSTGTTGIDQRILGTEYKVIVQNEEQVEISFKINWNTSQEGKLAPLNIDKRFIMLRDSPGLYSYAIYEHMKEWPAFNLPQTRIVFKLQKDMFRYMAVGDTRQRYMPLPDDRLPPRGQELAFSEAVCLVDPIEPEFKGEVDDKYEYSCENKDLKVHGWICTNPAIGFWQITPSNEFRSGGLIKQNLTSHVGPINLAMFLSTHYAGEEMVLKFQENEAWKKVFGPVFFYLNSLPTDGSDPLIYLWDDAKNQMMVEVESWPYNFVASEDFPSSDRRGSLTGRLLIQDRYISSNNIPGCGAYVGLAPPGEVGSWQTESKGYQFWTKADESGYFSINDVRSGDYNLYAWVPGFIGDYKYNNTINITAGVDIDVGDIVYEPPRHGATLWEIGIPDRSAGEFYVPDPNPNYVNNLYLKLDSDKFRQYGLWERYAELYPDADLVYTVGTSDYKNDWFFAQVTRKNDDDTYKGTTWQIKFYLEHVSATGIYKLRIALATAHETRLEVRVNDSEALLSCEQFGHDNAIARHGIHGLYRLYNVDIECSLFVEGDNTMGLFET